MIRAQLFSPVRYETQVMEEYCWVITDGRADELRPICFQCYGCLDFNWTPFYIHISLTTCILITDSPNIRLAPELPARNYCAKSRNVSDSHKSNSTTPNAEYIYIYIYIYSGPGSSVGIATDYGLDGPGSNPGGDEIFRPSRPALGPIQPPVKWVPCLSRG